MDLCFVEGRLTNFQYLNVWHGKSSEFKNLDGQFITLSLFIAAVSIDLYFIASSGMPFWMLKCMALTMLFFNSYIARALPTFLYFCTMFGKIFQINSSAIATFLDKFTGKVIHCFDDFWFIDCHFPVPNI